ncbi:serine/arginine (SR)-type shuttling mRNA binding protein Gbp2p [Trichomonascus vanleenenianus]|uniref:single-stranded telomeric DNA-binding/mRNA-binding protein n=1 Tax=Trichomonascus vanleenenianus TaxID=2268995 RepID=UPI003ECA3441
MSLRSRIDPHRDEYSRSRSRSPRYRDDRSPPRGSSFRSYRSNHSRSRSRSRSPPYRRQRDRGTRPMYRSQSDQARRVYVGNLSFDVKWYHLKDFMRQAGEVLHADVLKLRDGRSKGCGIVEYATVEEAQKAVDTLNNQDLMGRLVFVREDREAGGPPPGDSSSAAPAAPPHGMRHSDRLPPRRAPPSVASEPGSQLYVGNLPYTVAWQDLKDLFREAGNVVRADVQRTYDGRSKGSGIVVFETADEARQAIDKFNGYVMNGRPIEVREDRFAASNSGMPPPPPPPSSGGEAVAPNDLTDNARGGGEPSEAIFVGNLPWATTNDDLVELFETVGTVLRAEIQLLRNGKSAGNGVVRFDTPASAEIAISKFDGYEYGRRNLSISYVSYSHDPNASTLPPADDLEMDM